MLVIVYGTLPGLDNVTVWIALVVLTNWSGNVTEPGDTEAVDCVPTPLSEMFNVGVAGSLLVITRTELRLPIAVGLNAMLTVQVRPGVTLPVTIGQVLPVMRKSLAFPPAIVMPLKNRLAL